MKLRKKHLALSPRPYSLESRRVLPPAGEVAEEVEGSRREEVEGLRREEAGGEVEDKRKPGGRHHHLVEAGGGGAMVVILKGLGTTGPKLIGVMVREGHIMVRIEQFKTLVKSQNTDQISCSVFIQGSAAKL